MSQAAAFALMAGEPLDEVYEEREEGEDTEAMQSKMEEAMMLNAQLKEVLRQAEEQQRQAQRSRQQQTGGRPSPSRAQSRAGAAKNGGWGGGTHTDTRNHEISRENAILVSKLSSIATRGRESIVGAAPFRPPPNRSTITINNRRKDDQIARENAAMARRLNSVKATSTLSAKSASRHAQQHNKYLQVLRPPTYSSALSAPPQQLVAAQQRGRSANRGREQGRPQAQLVPRSPFQM